MANMGKLRSEVRKAAYDGLGDQATTDLINEPDKTMPAPDATIEQVRELIDPGEYRALTDAEREEIRDIYRTSEAINVNGSPARTLLQDLFGAGTTTRASLAVLATPVTASTADIEGLGEVRPSDVLTARAH